MAAATAMRSACAAAVVSSLAQAPAAKRSNAGASMSMRSLKAFGGLKPESQVSNLGVSQCTEQAFAAVRARCNKRAGASRGGAAASTCDVASEIFRIVPIMSGLTLMGIALGFVLLRVEAAVEESE